MSNIYTLSFSDLIRAALRDSDLIIGDSRIRREGDLQRPPPVINNEEKLA